MAKRGRKPKNKNYFGEEQELAVLEYLETENAELKNFIYNEKLKPAFEKMIESIIRRYDLYVPEETFDETFSDTLSFLITKAEKFDTGRNKKAYSYYGNICKNYLIGRNLAYQKKSFRNPPFYLLKVSMLQLFVRLMFFSLNPNVLDYFF